MNGVDPRAFEEVGSVLNFWGLEIRSQNVNFLGYISSRMNRKTKLPLKYKHK